MQKVTENYLSKVTRYFYFVTEQHWPTVSKYWRRCYKRERKQRKQL